MVFRIEITEPAEAASKSAATRSAFCACDIRRGRLWTRRTGVPQIHFHGAASSLEEAIRSTIRHVRSAGFSVARIEIGPEALALLA